MPFWFALILISTYLVYCCFAFGRTDKERRYWVMGLSGLCIIVALAIELPWHFQYPLATSVHPKRLLIIADSITAGIGEKYTYPQKLEALTGIKIDNFAQAGATVKSAFISQVPRLIKDNDPEAWVLLEIGGNDMLENTPQVEYREYLEKLLMAAQGNPIHPRTILMLELPIIPGCWSYGRTQRQLAQKYGVIFIPKRVLAGVILPEGNTIDGLHLSKVGHDRMADALRPWLGQSFK